MRVVVSLTTIPGRDKILHRTINSLLFQNRPPDAIYLWLPDSLFVGESSSYLGLDGIIVSSGPDLGPAMKLLPVLEKESDPETCIITVDDDIEYPTGLVERLIAASNLLPDHALGFTGWNRVDGPAGFEVHHYNEAVPQAAMFQPVQVLEGYRGVMYRRSFFAHDIHKHLTEQTAFRYHDDILISGYLASRGIVRSVCWYSSFPPPPGSHWQLHGDDIGLHTRPGWLDEAWRAWEYWTQFLPGIFHLPRNLSLSERLQLATGTHARSGFLHHCQVESENCDLTFDPALRPWPLPDEQFHELLFLDFLPFPEDIAQDWLLEAWRVLQLGGILRICMPQDPLASFHVPKSEENIVGQGRLWDDLHPPVSLFAEPSSSRLRYPGWRASWHREGYFHVGTFIKTLTQR